MTGAAPMPGRVCRGLGRPDRDDRIGAAGLGRRDQDDERGAAQPGMQRAALAVQLPLFQRVPVKVSIIRPVPPLETCATMAMRR